MYEMKAISLVDLFNRALSNIPGLIRKAAQFTAYNVF